MPAGVAGPRPHAADFAPLRAVETFPPAGRFERDDEQVFGQPELAVVQRIERTLNRRAVHAAALATRSAGAGSAPDNPDDRDFAPARVRRGRQLRARVRVNLCLYGVCEQVRVWPRTN